MMYLWMCNRLSACWAWSPLGHAIDYHSVCSWSPFGHAVSACFTWSPLRRAVLTCEVRSFFGHAVGYQCVWHDFPLGIRYRRVWHDFPLGMQYRRVWHDLPLEYSIDVFGMISPRNTVSACLAWSPLGHTVSVCLVWSPLRLQYRRAGCELPSDTRDISLNFSAVSAWLAWYPIGLVVSASLVWYSIGPVLSARLLWSHWRVCIHLPSMISPQTCSIGVFVVIAIQNKY